MLARVLSPLAVLALGTAACGPPPPPEEPPPPPAPRVTRKPPPPPKCESIEEKCQSGEETRARIAGIDYSFRPPKDWIYAQTEKGTVSQVDAKGPVLLLTSFATAAGAPAARKQREDRIVEVAGIVGIEPPKKKIALAPAKFGPAEYGTIKAGDVEVSYWNFSGAQMYSGKRAGEVGGLLVLAADVAQMTLFGLAFVPKTDASGAGPAIIQAVQTLERAQKPKETPADSSDNSPADGGEEDESP
ncbi:MAG: hypothetical protein HY744_19515 [Deltaproteobacteria bacterium]|nr:hypothetical protein [Deltaproteobacteria bacterium]